MWSGFGDRLLSQEHTPVQGVQGESNPLPTFIIRKLFIRRNARNAKNAKSTQFGYLSGYVASLSEHALILLITLAFCIYLIGGEGLQADALRAVFGILSILSVSFPMSAFGLDGGGGFRR